MTRAQRLSRATGIPARDLFGTCRKDHAVRARFAIMAAMRERGRSLNWIGIKLGNRDHSTVFYGLKRADQLQADPAFAGMVDRVREALL